MDMPIYEGDGWVKRDIKWSEKGHSGEVKWCRALPRCATINDGVKASSSVSFFFLKKSYYDVFCEAGLQHYKSWLRRKEEKKKKQTPIPRSKTKKEKKRS